MQYTEPCSLPSGAIGGDIAESQSIFAALQTADGILGGVNETIRDREGTERLGEMSRALWIGQGRLDLTAPTRHLGPRKLVKEGVLSKAKIGRKLRMLLCSDTLVLVDEAGKGLYRVVSVSRTIESVGELIEYVLVSADSGERNSDQAAAERIRLFDSIWHTRVGEIPSYCAHPTSETRERDKMPSWTLTARLGRESETWYGNLMRCNHDVGTARTNRHLGISLLSLSLLTFGGLFSA